MELDTIKNDLNEIFRRVFNDSSIELDLSYTANDVEGWDSLNHMILISEIEKYYKIKFSIRDLVRLKEVNDICLFVQKKV